MRPVGSSSSMPSITGGLNGAPAGRFLDVSGWVGVSKASRWTGQESNSAMDSGDRGGCSHNQYHVERV